MSCAGGVSSRVPAGFDVSSLCDESTQSLRLPPPLRPAPTFYPTEEEFRDPIAFVRSIAHIGQKTGICKIVPPKSWNPPFCLNADTFTFRSKVQRLDMLQKRGEGGGAASLDDAAVEEDDVEHAAVREDGFESAAVAAVASASPAAAASTPDAAAPKRKYVRKLDPLGKRKAARAARRSSKRAKSAGGVVNPYWNTRCEICQGADHDDKILLCDECDLGFHIFCLSPPLAEIPATDWYCPQCLAAKISAFGFDMGRTFTLRQYQTHADEFLRNWFTKKRATAKTTNANASTNGSKDAPTNAAMTDVAASSQAASSAAAGSAAAASEPVTTAAAAAGPSAVADAPFVPPTPSELNDAFWRILEHPSSAVSVDYGSDLDTEVLGSGFPKDGPYAEQLFNCNNLAMAKGSLINWLDESMLISGVTIPWLYVGMVFSTFCWHVEDHWMYSINYVHRGAPKQWYGVPSSSAGKFERKMRQALPNLFNLNPDLLFQLITMISPLKLATNTAASASEESDDPTIYYLLQNAGEFAITFPRSYHGGFNHGFNVAESVNFGGVEWLPHGLKCVERYRFFRRTPIFNHEQLVMRLVAHVRHAFEAILAADDKQEKKKMRRRHRLKNEDAARTFDTSVATMETGDAAPSSGVVSTLQSTAQRNQRISLARFDDIWYFAAWLLHQLQELLAREVAGRAALMTGGTLRGKIWAAENQQRLSGSSTSDPKRSNFSPLPTGSIVSATWQGNVDFNPRAPSDPSLFIWYDGTVIGWNSVTGLYSVRFHEDGLVDEHVLPKHIKYKGTVATSTAAHNEWLTYQACVDGGEQKAATAAGEDGNKADAAAPTADGPSSSDAATGAMKTKKLKKSAVDFSPAVSNIVACAICRHALHLSCVRCSCCPEKASCLLHAGELCACKGESKTIYFRYTIWQLENAIEDMQQVVNHREKKKQAKKTQEGAAQVQVIQEGSETRVTPTPSPKTRHPVAPASYNSLSDFYESASCADDFTSLPQDDRRHFDVQGTEPSEGTGTYPTYRLTFSTACPVFSMGVGEDDEEMPVDHLAPIAASDAATSASPTADASTNAATVAPIDVEVDARIPSTRSLSAILCESRRIMSEADDYVLAVGLRDESLAKAAASATVEEDAQRAAAEARLAQQQQSAPQRQSLHHSTLRSAARFSHPTTNAAPTKDVTEAMRAQLKRDADAWVARYSGWITQAEKAREACDAEQRKYATRLALVTASANGKIDPAAQNGAPVAAVKTAPTPVASPPTQPTPAAGAAVTSATVNPIIVIDDSDSEDDPKADVTMIDASPKVKVAELPVAPAVPVVAGSVATAPLASSISVVDPPTPSFRSFAFLTPSDLDAALHEGEKFIHGDSSFLPVCEIYGVLREWAELAARLSRRMCELVRVARVMTQRTRKLRESCEREWTQATCNGFTGASEIVAKMPYDAAQLWPSEAQDLRAQIARCPVQIGCMCAMTTPPSKSPAEAASLTSVPATSLTPTMIVALEHAEKLTEWLLQFADLLPRVRAAASDTSLALRAVDALPRTTSTSSDAPSPAQSFMSPFLDRLQTLGGMPFKAREKNAHLVLVKTMLERVKTKRAATAAATAIVDAAGTVERTSTKNSSRNARSGAATRPTPASTSKAYTFPDFASSFTPDAFGPRFTPSAPTAPFAHVPFAPFPFVMPLQTPPPLFSAPLPVPFLSSASLTPGAAWLLSVDRLLGPDMTCPPLLGVIYESLLTGKQLFPSLSPMMEFSHSACAMPDLVSPGSPAAASPQFFGIADVAHLQLMARRLTGLCWAAYWWLTQCRRLLARATPQTPLSALTPIASSHEEQPDLLDRLPIPAALTDWARSGEASHPPHTETLPHHPRLPWCSDVLSHMSAAVAKRSAIQLAGSSVIDPKSDLKYAPCCAQALLTAPILAHVDIPEAQVLEYLVQQTCEWRSRAHRLLPLASYVRSGVAPPSETMAREAGTSDFTPPIDSNEFRILSGSGSTVALLAGVEYEGQLLAFAPHESYILAVHLRRARSWQHGASRSLVTNHAAFARFHKQREIERRSDTGFEVARALADVEGLLREATQLSVWTEEAHVLLRMWHQGRETMRMIEFVMGNGDANNSPPHRLFYIYQQSLQAMNVAIAVTNPITFYATPTPPPSHMLPASNVQTVVPSSSNAPLPTSAAPTGSDVAASADIDPSLSGSLRVRIDTVDDMLERVEYATTNPIVLALPKSEREVFQGCSERALRKCRTLMRDAEQAGIDLNDYRPLPFAMLPALIAATPEERKAMIDSTTGVGPHAFAKTNAEPPLSSEDELDEEHGSDEEGAAGRSTRTRNSNPRVMPPLRPGHVLVGHVAVPSVTLLSYPPPTEGQRNTPGHVYSTMKSHGHSERKRLIRFVHTLGLFHDDGLLPFRGPDDSFGNLHPTRKNAAIRLIQDEFKTCPTWTRRFLGVNHSNQRRLCATKYQLGQAKQASGHSTAADAAASAAEPPPTPSHLAHPPAAAAVASHATPMKHESIVSSPLKVGSARATSRMQEGEQKEPDNLKE